jgi:hypothetical protein
MRNIRLAFFLTSAFCFVAGMAGIIAMQVMEYQARQSLPPEMQTPEAIYTYYDGAVCLGCDVAQIAFGAIGLVSGLLVLACWGIYEITGGNFKKVFGDFVSLMR